jgi:hypothetical protein
MNLWILLVLEKSRSKIWSQALVERGRRNTLGSVLHVPKCKEKNLHSVSQLGKARSEVNSGPLKVTVVHEGRCLAELIRVDGVDMVRSSPGPMAVLAIKQNIVAHTKITALWHFCQGHLGMRAIA